MTEKRTANKKKAPLKATLVIVESPAKAKTMRSILVRGIP